ncbi:unnamed protein product [Anisakis simplex]|uniref:Uncoordinated protein 79 (inferred by orthology to a C. elegans protein) n=1 Tax=Anisakis simplex TaxID=6269 RepID=A0A0M3KBS2_ANISI|nr:unnamed protein product [Anisakis simplex]
MCLLLNRVVDMENPERHIVYLTVSLFVTFLCNKKTAGDEKATAKKQSVLLRHFNTLIGYSNSEKCFTIPPRRLRYTTRRSSYKRSLLQSNMNMETCKLLSRTIDMLELSFLGTQDAHNEYTF